MLHEGQIALGGRVQKLKGSYLVMTLMLASLTAFAQTNAPAGQFFGGYQYTRLDTGAVQDAINLFVLANGSPAVDFGRHQNLNGWSVGGQENINNWFGVAVDLSGTYDTKKLLLAQSGSFNEALRSRLHLYTFMTGPQFTMRRSSTFQPFARGLIGGARITESANILVNNVPQIADLKSNDESFAFGGGGGTDINFSRRLGMRVAVDYIRTQFFNDDQNNLRGTVALVFSWGSTHVGSR
jgi:opacity protein-like surface antigen